MCGLVEKNNTLGIDVYIYYNRGNIGMNGNSCFLCFRQTSPVDVNIDFMFTK